MTEAAAKIMTAMIYLDDATLGNGCLEVAPGSHTRGTHACKTNVDGFGTNEMDEALFDMSGLQPVEAGAGSVIFFGAFLVHRSLPNRSDKDRRALLYSYQPARFPSNLEINRFFAWNAEAARAKLRAAGR